MPEPRLCEVCSIEMPTWKSKSATVCSVKCRFERRERRNTEARKKRPTKDKKNGLYLLHSCLTNGFDPFDNDRCKCRKLLTEEQANALIAQGDAVDCASRLPIFSFAPIVLIGQKKRTPRVPTLEKAHLERITEKPARAAKSKEKTLEELRAAVVEDRAERFEEEKLRMEFYNELTMEARHTWIKEIPADVYDAAKRRDWGRPLFTNFKDERTQGGIGVDVDPSLWNGDETEKEKEEAIEESDEQSPEKVIDDFSDAAIAAKT